MSEYKIVAKPGVGEFVDKKSRFIAHVYAIDSEEQAQGYIEELKKKYWDARHNCYGYVLGKNNETQRFSDDGEPSGTAGKPILEVIKGNDIHNILIVVTRYFGGTLLGTGGLIRAYTKSSQDGIENASIVCKIQGIRTKIETDYNGIGKIQYIAASMGIKNIDTIYTEKVIIDITVKKEDYDGFEKKVVEVEDEEFSGCEIKTVGAKAVLDLGLAVFEKDVYINFNSTASTLTIILPEGVNVACDIEKSVSSVKNLVDNVDEEGIHTVYVIGKAVGSSIEIIPVNFYMDDDDDFEDTDEDIFVDEDKQEAAAEKEALQPSEDGEADDKLDIEEVE